MPKVRRSSTLAYLPVQRPLIARLPRRMSAEDAEEQYRREKFGIPGPIDTFLAAQMARGVCCSPGKVWNTDADTSAFSQDEEVHCTVSVQRIKAPDDSDSIFRGPDTFVLHLTATTTITPTASPPTPPPTPRATDTTAAASVSWNPSRSQTPSQRQQQQQQQSEPVPGVRQAILGKYEGHPESLDAPEWTRLLPVGKPVVFRASAAVVAELLVHARAAFWRDAMAPLLGSLRTMGLDN